MDDAGRQIVKKINGTQKLIRLNNSDIDGAVPLVKLNESTEIYSGYLQEVIKKLELLRLVHLNDKNNFS